MAATAFKLVTIWRFAAPSSVLWDALTRVDEWPGWWRGVGVDMLAPGDADGIGAYRRMTWRTALPYTITFNMRTTRVEPPSVIEGRADGELNGTGRWTLTPDGSQTQVRYDWIVAVDKPWMRALAPLLRPVFAWNHGAVMERGRVGLARKLEG